MSEQERVAVDRLRQGDIQGLEALVRLHQVKAVRTAYAIIGDRQAAEDVVSDAFLAVYDRIGQYDPRRPFAPWLYRIVVNGALKAVRRTRHQAFMPEGGGDLFDALPADGPGPEEELIRREVRLLVEALVNALPPKLRAVLVLRFYLEMGEAEIAQTLACPLGTVKWRIHAAKAHLYQRLAEEGRV